MAKHSTGKTTEQEFEDRMSNLGKRAFCYRVEDASDLYGLNKKRLVNTTKKPSDFIVTLMGRMFYLECKDTRNPKGFLVSQISTHQSAVATMNAAAGGEYFFFVRNLLNGDAFFIPSSFMLAQRGCVLWGALTPFIWPGETLCPPMTSHG